MVGRKCPNCGIIRYSANTQDWLCEQCGNVASAKDEILVGGDENDGYRKRVSEQSIRVKRYKDSNQT